MACLALCAVLACFLADAGAVRTAAGEALVLCGKSVVPALFPFLVLSNLLIALGFGELASPYLAGFMTPLFRLPGAASSALLLGLAGGYPIGAKTAAELYRDGLLTKDEATRLLAFSNNANPVFLISILGVGVFGSVRAGIWLWLIHVASALLTGLLFRGRGKGCRERAGAEHQPIRTVSFTRAFVEAVQEALSAMLSVCAFVIFFYVAAHPLAALGPHTGPALVGALELFSLTPLLTPDRFGWIAASACAGWGGLSVLCQTMAVLEGSGLPIRNCVFGKLCQGVFSALLAALLAGYVV